MRRIGFAASLLLATSAIAAENRPADDPGYRCAPPTIESSAATIESCTQAIRQLSDERLLARARVFRGRAYQLKGDLVRAVSDFDYALATTPDDILGLQWRAQANAELKNTDEARADYEQLMRLQPDTRWRVALEQLDGTVAPPKASAATDRAPAVDSVDNVRAAPAPSQTPTTAPPLDERTIVRRLQLALRKLGYEVDDADGDMGPQTREAIDLFAADNGLPFGRPADAQLLSRAENSLRAQTELNRRAQAALRTLGLYRGGLDGAFGRESKEAFLQWLSAHGLPPRSHVDEQLAAEMERDAAQQ